MLKFLSQNPAVRARIAALPDATILYAGQMIRPAWKEIDEMRLTMPQLRTKKTLPEILKSIPLVGQPFPTLHAWAESLDSIAPWEHNGFIGWRALSGIFASNARGAVSFVVGSGVVKATKVFAATEVSVMMRNPNVDEQTRDLLEYYARCIKENRSDMCLTFIAG